MAHEVPKSQRRLLVVINYMSLGAIAFLVHVGSVYGWDARLRLVGILVALAALVITFVAVFWKTRLWQMAHASFERLDERQIQVMYDSLRHSYSVFALLCLVVLYVNAVAERGHIPILIAAGLLYLAHTLPAAFVAWTEREILIEN
jgi:mannose/fructose/N-acetylgalactosamine-specific phosphotransferase system component IIC